MTAEPITIIIVDDHPIFLQGVVDTLGIQPGFKVIGKASDGEAALKLIRSLQPQVAVVDINLPRMNGQQVTHLVVQEKLPTRVILLTAYDDGEQILHAAWAGAAGFCAKEIDPGCLVQAVRVVAEGNYFFGGKVFSAREFKRWIDSQMEIAKHPYSEPGSPFHPLSGREMEVLDCVVKGLSNKEIATKLGISHQTVKNHVTSILRKFGVEDRTQAVVHALKHGWVQLHSTQPKFEE